MGDIMRKEIQNQDTAIQENQELVKVKRKKKRHLPIFIKVKEKQEWGSSFKPLIPALCLFLRHLYYCQKFPILFQRSGVGRAHKRQ